VNTSTGGVIRPLWGGYLALSIRIIIIHINSFGDDDSVLLAIRLSCILTVHSLRIAALIAHPSGLLAKVGGGAQTPQVTRLVLLVSHWALYKTEIASQMCDSHTRQTD